MREEGLFLVEINSSVPYFSPFSFFPHFVFIDYI